MDFFKKLSTAAVGCKRVTLVFDFINGGIVLNVIPETGDKTIKERLQAKTISGTFEELDNGFFGIVEPEPVKEGLTVADAPEKEEEADADEKAEKKPAAKAKNKPVKKPAAKKKVVAPSTGPNSETDKHHQADLKENEVKDAQEQLSF